MMLNRLIGRRRASTLKRPAPHRRLGLEFLEPKAMVAGDIFSMGAASLFGVDSLLGANAPLIEQLSDNTEQVDIHLKITDTGGIAITQIEAGQDFVLQVWVQDVRASVPSPGPGVAAAYTNVTFDSSLVTPDGPLVHGSDYLNAISGDTLTAGKINEAGGFQGSSSALGAAEHMLFSQQMHVDAAASGNVSFTSSPATVLPAHDTLTFNPPVAVPTSDIGYAAASVTVIPQPTLVSSNVQQAEGTGADSTMTFTVNLTGTAATQTVTVDYATVEGTAHAGSDYVAKSGTLTFNVGETQKTFDVTIKGDNVSESDEQFSVTFSNASGALAPATATGTILNDDTLPKISVNDISAPEGNAGLSTASFTVSLSNPSDQPVSADYTFAPGTATDGVDYQAVAGTVNFAAGETSKQVDVSILGDTVFEADETFTIALQNPQGGTIDKATGTATITDDDAMPTLAINSPVAVTEPTGATTTLQFTVTLTGDTALPTTVQWNTADVSATASQDYQAASGQLTFLPGETSKTLDVTILDDNLNEATETFGVQLTSPSNATVTFGSSVGIGTILDDGDAAPTVSMTGTTTVTEGNTGDHNDATYNVQLSGPSGQTVTVDYAAVDGSGVVGTDYEASSGTLTFAPGVVSLPITVKTIGNTIDQGDRTFKVDLSNPQHTSINVGEVVTTIQDDDDPPVLSIGNQSIVEGDSATKTMTFTVNLSNASDKTVTVDFATADNTATVGSDYETKSGTLTFAPLETSKTISVDIDGDTDVENNETFFVNLSNAQNATPTSLQATGTIQDDDGFVVTVADAQVTETDSTNTTMTFTATLARPASDPLTFNWSTSGGSATPGVDYQTASGTATIAAGATTTTFTVNVIGDTINEDDETFHVNLTNPTYGSLANAQTTGTIIDNDAPPTVSITGGSITEGNSGTKTLDFTVNLDNPSGKTVTADFATANGTATAGSDYVTKTGTVTFLPGQTSQTVSVLVNGDTDAEQDETFTVGLTNAPNATIGTQSATGTILDDDNFVLTVANTSVAEGNSNTTQMTFTLTLSKPAVGPLTVTYVTAPGAVNPATAGVDYDTAPGSATIADGATSTTVQVTVHGDTTDEADETLQLSLTNPTYGTVQGSPATGTIINDDTPPTMSIANASAAEGDATGNPLSFVVTLSQASGKTVTVDFATDDVTAIDQTDYLGSVGKLTFAPGETTKTITVHTIGNTTPGSDKTFVVNLTGATNATIPATPSATGTILDDDTPTISVANSSVTEGNSSTKQMTFTATLSKASDKTVTFKVETADGTATAGQDYQAASGTLTFNPGETSQQFTLTIGGDTLFEADETVLLNLSAPTNATIATPQVTGTILNDDTAPQVFVTAPSPVAEGDSGVTPMTFQVFLLAQTGLPVTINYSTANGTATAGSDYQATTGSVTFAVGESFKTITVNVLGDTAVEPTEAFSLNLSATNAVFFGGVGASTTVTGTILDDDTPNSISGLVFRDTNNNGKMDGPEIALPGVTVMLSGIDSGGNTVVRFATTAGDGTYSFSNVPKGTFTVTETQPAGYLDGIDTPGAGAAKTPGVNDQFTITTTGGQTLVGNNFAERGISLLSITKGLFLSSRTDP